MVFRLIHQSSEIACKNGLSLCCPGWSLATQSWLTDCSIDLRGSSDPFISASSVAETTDMDKRNPCKRQLNWMFPSNGKVTLNGPRSLEDCGQQVLASGGDFPSMPGHNTSRNSSCDPIVTPHLISLYFIVLIGGLVGVISILFLLVKMNTRSVTTMAVINLVVVHSVFLLTVPFRLTYLIKKTWMFGLPFCKFVSAMLHIHMYLTFLFYVVILVTRYLIFFKCKDKVEFYRKLHAVAASAGMWTLVIVIVVPLVVSRYGIHEEYNEEHCFKFHKELAYTYVKIINYMIVIFVIAVAVILLVFQVFIIMLMVQKLRHSLLSHQEFWAQLKNLFFIGVILVCFLPYQFFRIYYLNVVTHSNACNSKVAFYNEIFLSVTAISCYDLLLFVFGGSHWFKQKIIGLWNCVLCR
ncbi:putative G-protein coupled receptor 141 isoform X2 [Homo sapiens]|uniref:putative G-protein coupled receptor 141 isoform X2 n=1 Tax=Homo sapiens TaxID=9606 RepID=UPI0005D02C09|nr:probable G-protein coupled receptor 141 isoform X2 [Homo sapiens]XP_054214110.1 probable G-protein coupled receptor 141 isoform X2 [Homo sapiens]|eukprot:XP_011513677.1 probable G-protein coupled receptor 141 isoform X2 [Homo sapiens]